MKYKFLVWGKVKKGKKRGKKLGFPTANITLHKNIPQGIYASTAKIGKNEFPSVTFIGAAKTFKENDIKGETFILDFDKNIYGRWISIKLFKKIRSNKKFDSIKALKAQMRKDLEETKLFFKSRNLINNK